MPPKRRATAADLERADRATEEKYKKLRSVVDETAEEFLCAITMALPVDPVTAQDGHVYERSAIEELY